MEDSLLAYRVAQLERDSERLEARVQELEVSIRRREVERHAHERALFWRGIAGLGFLLSVLVGVIWSARASIFR